MQQKIYKTLNDGGINNDGNMDRGPIMFTSDVSLPKDDKTAKMGEQITARQLTELSMHRNSNYATKKLEAQSYGKYADTSRPFIHQHLLTNHPP